MVIPVEREGTVEDDPALSRDVTPAKDTVNSRKGGLQASKQPRKVRPTVKMLVTKHYREVCLLFKRYSENNPGRYVHC